MNKASLLLLAIFAVSCSSKTSSESHSGSHDPSVPVVAIAPREQVEAHGKKWMISTQGKYSTQIANQILKDGGSLMDAAIAASFAIGVERPQSTGIGGGGFLIYHEAKSGKNYVFDFRERAPSQATKDMFLDENGKVVPERSETGPLAVGVPGMVRGLKLLHDRFGKTSWAKLIQPSEELARKGIPIYPSLEQALKEERDHLVQFSESRTIFLDQSGKVKQPGQLIIQENLAHTLKILERSPEDFYTGEIAKKIVKSVRKHGGILSLKDLKKYQVKERQAVEADWHGLHIVSMPPPSSGGIHIIQILKMLEGDKLEEFGFLSPKSLNLTAQSMQQAFADRARFLGDPDFVHVPSKQLLSDAYLKGLRSKFKEEGARKGTDVHSGVLLPEEHHETSHLTLMDSEGNAIVSTQTINGLFGSDLVAEGTGIVLNNEMDDFSAQVGAKNGFGATSTSLANSVEPNKTPLSSMSPTLVFKDGKPILALGAPGGTRIITSVAQTLLNYFVYHQDLYHSIAAPRIHEQWQPDELFVENQDVDPALLSALSSQGWRIKRVPTQSRVMAVAREGDELIGVADPRDIGTSSGE